MSGYLLNTLSSCPKWPASSYLLSLQCSNRETPGFGGRWINQRISNKNLIFRWPFDSFFTNSLLGTSLYLASKGSIEKLGAFSWLFSVELQASSVKPSPWGLAGPFVWQAWLVGWWVGWLVAWLDGVEEANRFLNVSGSPLTLLLSGWIAYRMYCTMDKTSRITRCDEKKTIEIQNSRILVMKQKRVCFEFKSKRSWMTGLKKRI